LQKAIAEKSLRLNSNQPGKMVKLSFKGTQIALTGKTDSHGGYAFVEITDRKGKKVYSSLLDCYSKVPQEGIRVITPKMPLGKYVLTVKVTGERTNWSDKSKRQFGTDDCFVRIDKAYVF
jgi:hypothetical protein